MQRTENYELATKGASIADQVAVREAELLLDDPIEVEPEFVRASFENNERGDGLLFAALYLGRWMYMVTPDKKGEWYQWDKHVWQVDDGEDCFNAMEEVALSYDTYADELKEYEDKLSQEGKEIPAWLIKTIPKYRDRAWKLRGKNKIATVLHMAPRVDKRLRCRVSDLDQKKMLLPCKNGVLNLEKGVIQTGDYRDHLTKKIDVTYNKNADYSRWEQVITEICVDPKRPGTEELPAFLKRLFGFALTGETSEQYLFVFIGPGRNGKGVLFDLIASVFGPYYHEANHTLFVEQRNEPPPSATSEHLYALLGKRIVVGAETNDGQKIDASRIKSLTGENKINCRRNYGSEQLFDPTHTLFLQTNHIPYGLTKDFALTQRLLIIELPWMFVEDVEYEEAKEPALKGQFKKKNDKLKDELKREENREGILRWLVEGCLEWQEHGLKVPDCILRSREKIEKQEDYLGQFLDDVISHDPTQEKLRMSLKNFYKAFSWWWGEHIDSREKSMPHKNTVAKNMRKRGYIVEKEGGDIRVFHVQIKGEMSLNIQELVGL